MIWSRLLRPLLFLLDAETAHRLAFGALRAGLAVAPVRAIVARATRPDPALRVRAFGVDFPSPVGLAAGFDKDAAGVRQLAALGFGFVEVGTVTPRPQPGNPRPRLFRLPRDRALLNRMGFNSGGVASPSRAIVVFVAMTPARPSSSARSATASTSSSDRSGAIFTSTGRPPAASLTAASSGRRRATACRSRRPGVFGDETFTAT